MRNDNKQYVDYLTERYTANTNQRSNMIEVYIKKAKIYVRWCMYYRI